jgi:hypothetical protein
MFGSPLMKKPLVGVIGSSHLVNDRIAVQQCGMRNLQALAEVAGALPMMFAGCPDITNVEALLEAVDGILLTGGRALWRVPWIARTERGFRWLSAPGNSRSARPHEPSRTQVGER